MKYVVTLPDLGEETAEKAIISRWLVEVGGVVAEGGDLLELTTDKAAFTAPSPRRGTLVEKMVHEDDAVAVGDGLCVLDV